MDYLVDGATGYKGVFYYNGDIWIAYSTTEVAKTTVNYSTTLASVYETLFLGEVKQEKKLISVGVSTEVLPIAGVVTLKYRLKEDSDWTTIFQNTENDSRYHEAINIEATGESLFEYKEVQFRVESKGGAVITGLNIKYEELDSNLT